MFDNIAGYKVTGFLGEGNYGKVLEAECPDGKPCAIKVEPKSASVPLLKHEATVLLNLKNLKGVPPVYKYGQLQNYRYLIMPKLSMTLSSLMDSRTVTNGDVEVMLLHLREIMAGIHKEGFVHRDVKPDNIMFDDTGRLYLIDFGFCTRIKKNKVEEMNRTTQGSAVGTLDFLGEKGLAGYVTKEVDYESLDRVKQYCLNKAVNTPTTTVSEL